MTARLPKKTPTAEHRGYANDSLKEKVADLESDRFNHDFRGYGRCGSRQAEFAAVD